MKELENELQGGQRIAILPPYEKTARKRMAAEDLDNRSPLNHKAGGSSGKGKRRKKSSKKAPPPVLGGVAATAATTVAAATAGDLTHPDSAETASSAAAAEGDASVDIVEVGAAGNTTGAVPRASAAGGSAGSGADTIVDIDDDNENKQAANWSRLWSLHHYEHGGGISWT